MFTAFLIAGALATAPVTDLETAPPSNFAGLVDVMTGGRSEARAALDMLVEDMLVTGAPVAGWNESAFDFEAWLGSQGAGPETHVLYDDTDGLRAIVSLSGGFDIDPLPYRFAIVGDVDADADKEQTLQRLGEGIYLNYRGGGVRNGSALCAEGGAAEIMATRPPGDWTNHDWQMVLAVGAFVEMAGTRDICTAYGVTDDGRLSERFFTSDGEPYVVLNEAAQPWQVRGKVEALRDFFAD